MISVFLWGKLCSGLLGDVLTELRLSTFEGAGLVSVASNGLTGTRLYEMMSEPEERSDGWSSRVSLLPW